MRAKLLPLSLAFALVGCASTRVTTPLVRAAVSSAGPRHAIFESTLRTLDERPEYVDEFVRAARAHPRTLDRFNANYAPMLADPAVADLTARHLARSPAGLQQVLESTLDASRDRPDARAAIATAIRHRSDLSASIIGNDRAASLAMARGSIRAAQASRRGRANFLAGMRATAHEVAALVASDPQTASALAAATADAAAQRAVTSVRHAIPGTQPGEGSVTKHSKR
jgi:hypothetical protein